MFPTLAFALVSVTVVYGQQAGTLTAEVHPALTCKVGSHTKFLVVFLRQQRGKS